MSSCVTPATLAQILESRDERAQLQQQFLQAHRCPVICFTMNIAGPVKTSPAIERAFRLGLELLEEKLPANAVQERRVDLCVTGCQAIYAVSAPATELKQICVSIEENMPLGRLFDMDVLDVNGVKLERHNLRDCIVCHAPGRVCAAGRLHSVEQLQKTTGRIIHQHFLQADAEAVATLAVQSLIDEVNTTPKPGLVDRRNSGSHTDMNITHFLRSANALKGYFQECFEIGQATAAQTPQETFPLLRQAGIRADEAMYRATDGVNTHKGAIYMMGVLCGSVGRLWSVERPFSSVSDITAVAAQLVRDTIAADFANAQPTAGIQLYQQYGIKGIRGEVAAGLPAVTALGLPVYEKLLDSGLSSNDAGAITLLHLIAKVQDTNLYHRGGQEGALWAAQSAEALLATTPHPSLAEIEALDDAFIKRNLSPGGCADLLAVTYFLHRINKNPV